MHPQDDDTSVQRGPSDPATSNEPEPPRDADAAMGGETVGQPLPTGLLNEPAPAPVLVAPERRRGWAFTASLLLVTVMGGAALFMSGYSVGRDAGVTAPGEASDADAWKPFWSAYTFIRDEYPLQDIDRTTLIRGAIRGMVDSVDDPYSSFLSPVDFQGTINDISGTFEGIGAEIGAVDAAGNAADCSTFGPDCHLVIIAPLAGSPSEAAGLKAGDIIVSVDGTTLDGLTPDEARDRVRGKAGTEVKLHVQRFEAPVPAPTARPGAGPTPGTSPAASPGATPSATQAPVSTPKPRVLLEEFDVTIVRAKIQRREVRSRVLAGGTVGYVSLAGFSGEGSKQLQEAIQAHLDKGIKKLVFDLRGDPGGFVTDALHVASEFLPDGVVYWNEDAEGVQTEIDAEPGGIATDPSIEVVVLVDRGSASASELVAGALQDRGRATLVGETTFGKGTVQQWLDLGTVGGVKLTVAKWLTPDKRWIHRVGLTPDVVVTVPTDTPQGVDPVLDRALQVLGESAADAEAFLLAA
jgi:carboxyl-terminal processing protease